MQLSSSFVILWAAFGQYEYIRNYPDCPHDYAWASDKYKISPYIIIPVEGELKKFRITPEDQILEKVFNEYPSN